jgi:sugar lactone lactonase YvrE
MALPDGVAVDSAGNLYIADTVNHRIRKVTVDGTIQTIAGSSNYGTSGDGGPASQALLINPRALVFDAGGNLLLTDSSAHMVRRITPAGIIQRVSGTGVGGHTGDGGPAIAAEDWTPWGLAADSAGNIYIGDTGSYTVRMVSPSGIIQTLLSDVYATGLLVDGSGNLWIAGNPALAVFTETSSPIPLAPAIAGNYFASNGIANSADPIFGQAGVVAAGEMVTVTGSYL